MRASLGHSWLLALALSIVACSDDGASPADGATAADQGAPVADAAPLLPDAPVPDASGPVRVLFIRGGPGTGGFLEGGADGQLSDITDTSTKPGNHGWAQLADELRALGMVPEQRIEGPVSNNTPVALTASLLARYRVVVFGSNNAAYPAASVKALLDWVRAGGGALFISDANWGSDWHDASDSDQAFLDQLDLKMNQDHGTYVRDTSHFAVPTHPVLAGVKSLDGEGVTPLTVTSNLPGVDPLVLVPAAGKVRRNTNTGQGPLTDATAADGAVVLLELGQGRVAGHFDRNTFFNKGGAGTSIARLDNRRYARNMFSWLAGK
mgnify:CR=1 FL=1